MQEEENKQRVYDWFEEVWNRGRVELIEEMVDPECSIDGLGESFQGPGPFKQLQQLYVTAIPDLKIDVDQVMADGDWIATRFHGAGTHTGPGLGNGPTGNRVAFTGMSFTRWKDGRMVEAHNNVDLTEIHRQAGML